MPSDFLSYLQQAMPLPSPVQPPQRMAPVPASQALAAAATPMPPAPQEPGALDVLLNHGGPLGLAWWAIQKRQEEANQRRARRKEAEDKHGVVKKGGTQPPKEKRSQSPLSASAPAVAVPIDRPIYDSRMPSPRPPVPGAGGVPPVAQPAPAAMPLPARASMAPGTAPGPAMPAMSSAMPQATGQPTSLLPPPPMPTPRPAMPANMTRAADGTDPLASLPANDPLRQILNLPPLAGQPEAQSKGKSKDWNRFLLEAGLAMMQAGGTPGTSTLGAVGTGALTALQTQEEREATEQQMAYERAQAEREMAVKLWQLQADQELALRQQQATEQWRQMQNQVAMQNAQSQAEWRRMQAEIDRQRLALDQQYKSGMLSNDQRRTEIAAARMAQGGGGGGGGAAGPASLKPTDIMRAMKDAQEMAQRDTEQAMMSGAFNDADDYAAASQQYYEQALSKYLSMAGMAPPTAASADPAAGVPAEAEAIRQAYREGKISREDAAKRLSAIPGFQQ